jgi:hypothetical protein
LYEPRDLARPNRKILPINNNPVAVLVDDRYWRPASANRPISITPNDNTARWISGAYPDAEDEHEAGHTY